MLNKCIRSAPIDLIAKDALNGVVMQKAALTKLSVGAIYGRLKKGDITMPHRCDAQRHRRAIERDHPLAIIGRADEDERIAEKYP
jgi:hypothetical protein